MALVAATRRRLTRHEGEQLVGRAGGGPVGATPAPSAILRVDATMRDVVGGVVLPEEELPGLVGEGDALAGHLEVDGGRRGQRPCQEELGDSLPDGLDIARS